MNWYSIFYWLSVAQNARAFFITGTVVFTIIFVVSMIWYFLMNADGDEKERNNARTWSFWSGGFGVFFWLLLVFTPSRRDTLLIIAGGGAMEFLTTDSTARQLPHELTSFVVGELRLLATDAKVELLSSNAKENILREAKELTTEELLSKMRTDSTFANIILNK